MAHYGHIYTIAGQKYQLRQRKGDYAILVKCITDSAGNVTPTRHVLEYPFDQLPKVEE